MSSSQLDFFKAPDEPLTWKTVLGEEKQAPYFQDIMATVESERKAGKVIYPKNSEIFNALTLTPFEEVKVVILGQDPYHGPNQAHGLCFSVKQGVQPPPSLINVYQELNDDLGIPIPNHGFLEKWAKQGVLLLNTSLTVEASKPQSHAGIGWHRFTDRIIRELSEKREGIIFLLWGSHAQKKAELVDSSKHHILTAPHPSPLSAHRGFFGCKHFSKTNEILRSYKKEEIDWDLTK